MENYLREGTFKGNFYLIILFALPFSCRTDDLYRPFYVNILYTAGGYGRTLSRSTSNKRPRALSPSTCDVGQRRLITS